MFVARVTRLVLLVEQELLSHPEHLSSSLFCSGLRVAQPVIFYICFEDHCFSFSPFVFSFLLAILLSLLLRSKAFDYPLGIISFGHSIVSPSSIQDLWLPSLYHLFWPFYCLSFFDLRPLITPLISSNFSFLTHVYSILYFDYLHWQFHLLYL